MAVQPQRDETRDISLFDLYNATKDYQMGEVSSLHGMSLPIYAGEFLVIQTPSGLGKSTLLNIIGGHEATKAQA